jgi:hypothetical protein
VSATRERRIKAAVRLAYHGFHRANEAMYRGGYTDAKGRAQGRAAARLAAARRRAHAAGVRLDWPYG